MRAVEAAGAAVARSVVRIPGGGATTAAWSLAWRAYRYAGVALPLSQTSRFML